jgi:hypothetical protein
MIIVDGYAYANDMKPVFAVVEARPLEGRKLFVRFNNGASCVSDLSPLLEKPIFAPLRDDNVFRNVSVEFSAPSWADGEVDIAPEWLYDHGAPCTPTDINIRE